MVDTAAWNQGLINAQALGMGDVLGKLDRAEMTAEAMKGVVEAFGEEIVKLRNGQQTFQEFLAEKSNKESINEFIEIFGAVRPDLLAEDASIGAKRVMNLRLFAWTEWFQQTIFGQVIMGEEKAPILRHLSETLSENDGKVENPEAAVSALNDIAARMEFAIPMENGHEWVEDRIHEMAKTVEWNPDDPTIPLAASIEQVVPNLVDSVKRKGEPYDPFGRNMYGIDNMAAR